MKITLINAQICEANNLVPPLGILAIGSYLDTHGFTVQLIDEDIFTTDITEEVKSFKPDLIGVSFLTPAYTRARKIIEILKPLFPATKFCAGGFHASILPRQVVTALSLDFCIIGEGELTMLEVCQHIEQKTPFSMVPGICYSTADGQTKLSPPRHLFDNLDVLPLPATRLLPYERYLLPPGLFRGVAMERITTISTSRGCPFHCSYCGGRKLFDGRVRLRSAESIRTELEYLINTHNIRGIWIIDECFTIDRDRAWKIANIIAEYGLAWGVQTRVDLVDQEIIKHFKQCGCIEINFGVESGVSRILGMLKKGTSVETAAKTFSWCRNVGMRTTANFMIGSPTETEAEMLETFHFAKRLRASYTIFHITTPLPGTELYEKALISGRLKQPVEFDESWVHRSSKGPLMATEVSGERLMKMRSRFQNHFFIRNYVTWHNLRYAIRYLLKLFTTPAIMLQSYRSYRQHGRLDSFIETMIALINKRER